MSFSKNSAQQTSLFNPIYGLTDRERKTLASSWATVFSEEIFPAIDEERFSVLYSDNPASRPNTPVNILVGAYLLKEIFDKSDDEMVEALQFDIRFQIALHTADMKEQPLSDKSLSRFRKRCYEYETDTGIDLFKDCVKDLGTKTAKLMHPARSAGRLRESEAHWPVNRVPGEHASGWGTTIWECFSIIIIQYVIINDNAEAALLTTKVTRMRRLVFQQLRT